MKRKMEKKQEQFFDALYEQWFSKLCIYANVKINNPPVAEEIVQDTFLVAFLKIEQLMEAEQPERWLKKTVKHKILHYFRDQGRKFDRVIPLAEVPERWVSALDERIEKNRGVRGRTEKRSAKTSGTHVEGRRTTVVTKDRMGRKIL